MFELLATRTARAVSLSLRRYGRIKSYDATIFRVTSYDEAALLHDEAGDTLHVIDGQYRQRLSSASAAMPAH